MPAKGESGTKFKGAMCIDIIKMFARGKTRAQFSAKHNICKRTFDTWLDKYPMFLDAYIRANEKARAYYDDIAEQHLIEEHKGPKLNTRLYELIMRNRFEMPATRIVRLEGMAKRTVEEKLQSICDAVAKGLITPDEAQKLGSLIDSTIKADEYAKLKKMIEEIEEAKAIGIENDGFIEVDE